MTDDFFVGKAEHLKATAIQVFGSGLIPRLLLFGGMVFSIHFYDKTAGKAYEVNDAISYYILKAESVSKSIATKMLPEKGLGLGGIAPKFFLKLLMLPITHRMSPHISRSFLLCHPNPNFSFTSPLRGAWVVLFFTSIGLDIPPSGGLEGL